VDGEMERGSSGRPRDTSVSGNRPDEVQARCGDLEIEGGPLDGGGDLTKQEESKLALEEFYLKRANEVLQSRTTRFVVILECVADVSNRFAILRTAEALGVLEVWVVRAPKARVTKGALNSVSKKAQQWLILRYFSTTSECIAAARAEGRCLWVTHLHAQATPLVAPLTLPPKFAIVIGSEHFGVSEEMQKASSKVVYLPMYGFVESLNVSVATAIVIQRLFDLCPEARGDLSNIQKQVILPIWMQNIAKRL